MDDPISALDASVRKKIFQNVILGHLRSKTRLLVTHAIDFIHLADSIVIMDKGRIVKSGTYEELKDSPVLTKLLSINKINQDSGDALKKGNKDQEAKIALEITHDNKEKVEIDTNVEVVRESVMSRQTEKINNRAMINTQMTSQFGSSLVSTSVDGSF